MRIALAQVNFIVGDIAGNARKILKWVERARTADADIVAFPELAISGYPPEDLLFKKAFIEDCMKAAREISSKIRGIHAIVGLPYLSDSLYNGAVVISEGREWAVCRKIHLPNYGVFDEKRYFKPAGKTCILSFGTEQIGLSICEDIWKEDVARVQVGRGGAQLLLNISASPYHAGKGGERAEMLRRRAMSNEAYVAYVNLVGGQDELVFDGQSLVISPDGKIIARAAQFSEDLLVCDIEMKETTKSRGRIPAGIGIEKFALRLRKGAKKPVEPVVRQPMGRLEEIYTAIVVGTRDYVRKNGFQKVVIGLSGGIDSSVVAVIAVDALGKENVIGVSMPSRYSSPHSVTDARELADRLGIRFLTIDIEPIFKSYLESLKASFNDLPRDVTEENIQARIRGNLLMALSNKFGWLVLTTGNKSELAVGYCTLYGDLAGGFAILKDVPKTLVYDLATYRNSRAEPVIPERIFTKPPSAELKPDQKDEDSLPPYEVLDKILSLYVEEDMSVDEIVRHGFRRSLVARVANLVDSSEYKRRQGPPGVKITPKAFGKDRRMPITNHYRARSSKRRA